MLSYHNDASLKSLIVAEMRKHKEQDQFLKGTYERLNGKFKGCAVGCAIDSMNVVLGKSYKTSDHNVFEEALGIPEWLAYLQDSLFEGLPNEDSAQFAVDFLDSIPVGVNLEPVKYKFCAFLMRECIERVLGLPDLSDELREKVLSAIRGALKLNEDAIETGKWDLEAMRAAEDAIETGKWDLEAMRAAREAAVVVTAAAALAARDARSVAWAVRCAAGAAVEAAQAQVASARDAASVGSAAWAADVAAWESAVSEVMAAEERLVAWSAWAAVAYKRYSGELIRLLKEQS